MIRRLFLVIWLASILPSLAQNKEVPGYTFHYNGVDLSQVWNVYTNLTGLTLEMDPAVSSLHTPIHLNTEIPMTKAGVVRLVERTLREQAGIVITRLDNQRAKVTYDASVKTVDAPAKPQDRRKIILTAADVVPKSVRVITGPGDPSQNLIFEYTNKTPEEIGSIWTNKPHVQILKDGQVILETDSPPGGYKDHGKPIGLVLMFRDYNKAKLAEKILRGED